MAMTLPAAGAAGHGGSARRLLIALGVSLFVHYLIAGGWSGAGGLQRATVAPLPLQARLEPREEPGSEPLTAAAHDGMAVSAPLAAPARARQSARSRATPPPVLQANTEFANGPDTRFYLARELDHYPAPLAPLGLRSHTSGAAGSVRLWISIDHAGQVVDVAVVDAEPPGMYEQHARDLVLATPFAPARKDGRPVKSRVLLALRYGS